MFVHTPGRQRHLVAAGEQLSLQEGQELIGLWR
jgi:hypothetical protein